MKKKLFYVLNSIFMILLYGNAMAQLTTGDVAFTAFNADGDDDFAIVVLVDIPANSTLYFSDNEPNAAGDGFDNFGEGSLQWDSGASVINAGSIIVFTDTDSAGNPNFGASVGVLSVATFDPGMNLSGGGDALYCVQGSPDGNNITAWLAGIQNEANNQGTNFAATGLTMGSTFINYFTSGSPDGGEYTGPRAGAANFSDYLSMLGNNANWTTETSNGENILPIDTTVFTISGGVIGNAPILNVPVSPVTEASEAGICGAVVNYAASAVDIEDGGIIPVQISPDPAVLASGDVFPVGTTNVVFSVEDSDGNIVVEDFDIIVEDVEDPIALCQNMSIELNAAGVASITPSAIDNGSSDNCGFTLTLDKMTFDCGDVGENTVTLTITDDSGNTDTCEATVTIIDDTAPVVNCIGNPSGLEVFINEFHYDNTGADTNEFIEIAGPAGTDLTDWAIWKYNGNNSQAYGDGEYLLQDSGASVLIDDEGNGFGALVFDVGSLQNGSPDGFALVDNNGNVVQFLSYEGSFTAANQVAAGMMSEDVGVFEPNSTPIGESLQLSGTGSFYAGFTWNAPLPETPGSLNVGQTIEAIVPSPPYEIVLEADGTITIPATTFINSIDEACGYTVGAGTEVTASLETGFAGGNGFSGNMFDLTAINALTINTFDINLADATTDDIEVWARTGSYSGFENSNAGWTLIATATAVVSNGANNSTPLNLDLAYELAAGETHAFYITTTLGGTIHYTNGGTTGDLHSSDANLEFYEGNGGGYFDVTFSPRVFNGNIHYTAGAPTTFEFDCSDIGERNLEIFVTDNSGNTSSCSTAVVISDETAPVLVCGPEPLLFDNGSGSDSPSLFFGDGTPLVTSVINITDNFTVTDLIIDLDISHAWSGDVAAMLTSPDGTSVVLFQMIGSGAFGCGEPDVMVTLDDEASNPVTDACPPNGTYSPENMLSAFDGENLMGDWTLTIEDTFAALDDGTLNSWTLNYEYSYPNPSTDINIELDATGNYTISSDDMLSTLDEACGIDVILTDVTDVDCSDIGTPIMVTVFANDASGNFASCQKEVNVVDWMAPVLTCPGDMTGADAVPSDNNGMFTIPDYFALAEADATDNCTDASSIVLTQ
ncbi:MAG TPA: hypothetical protein EYG92_06005, partial [Lutibacter sp.]|nr:hypothetical protein [Lutibacter sp.]